MREERKGREAKGCLLLLQIFSLPLFLFACLLIQSSFFFHPSDNAGNLLIQISKPSQRNDLFHPSCGLLSPQCLIFPNGSGWQLEGGGRLEAWIQDSHTSAPGFAATATIRLTRNILRSQNAFVLFNLSLPYLSFKLSSTFSCMAWVKNNAGAFIINLLSCKSSHPPLENSHIYLHMQWAVFSPSPGSFLTGKLLTKCYMGSKVCKD